MRRRRIRLTEPRSGLDVAAELHDAAAPGHADVLWALAGAGRPLDALHAIWTGPEISAQIDAADVPGIGALVPENTTTHPAAGDIALVAVGPGVWPALPDGFLDIGIFYAPGARLLLPHGWVAASVCAAVSPDASPALAAAGVAIRRGGACRLHLSQLP